MSFFRLPKLFRGRASKEASADRSGLTGRSAKESRRRRVLASPRRLCIDPLEARELLSVSAADTSDVLASQSLSLYDAAFPEATLRAEYPANSQFTDAATALAADDSGDFVITWTRNDTVTDIYGNDVSDLNIYARYLTDEVQRVFLPDNILANNNAAAYSNGKFSVQFGGNEVQKLTISATYENFSFYQQNITGWFTLGFDVDDNGSLETTTIVFNEDDFGAANPTTRPQAIIQSQLRGLGGVLADCTVEAVSPQEYVVYFGDASGGEVYPLITLVDQSFSGGFFPSVDVSMVRQPTTVANINVASTNNTTSLTAEEAALATATQIENAFARQTETTYATAPIDVQAPDEYDVVAPSPAPYETPITTEESIEVSVVPVDAATCEANGWTYGTVFDITFAGDYAKENVELLKIVAVTDDAGADLSAQLTTEPVTTLKESSDEFRVNPAEPVDPVTGEIDPYDQRNPAVAMDSDGDFVITWESDVPNSESFGSVSDIYARRFSPMGLVDDPSSVRGFVTQGVRAIVNDIQVITFDSTVSGTLVGTFRLQIPDAVTGDAWTSEPITFDSRNLAAVTDAIEQALVTAGYSGAQVRQLTGVDPYQFEVTFGGRQSGKDQPEIVIDTAGTLSVTEPVLVTDETDSTFLVNTTRNLRQCTPAIGVDGTGGFVITWSTVAQDMSYYNRVGYQRYSRDGDRVGDETLAPIQGGDVTAVYLNPAVAVSQDGHFALAWEMTTDPSYFNGAAYATSISALIYDATGAYNDFDGDPTTEDPDFLALGAGAAGDPSLAFDRDNNLGVAWNVIVADNIGGGRTMDSQAVVFDVNGTTIRPTFRINSGTDSGTGTADWSMSQEGPQMAFDADGDLIATYDGYGVDLSQYVYIPGSYFADYINATTNSDLLAFFNPQVDSLYGSPGNSSMSSDVDGAIEYVLINAYTNGATDTQIGRLRIILDKVAGLLRGDANGVMFTRWDTDPNEQSTNNTLTSDNQANSDRDGHNSRILLAIPTNASSGNITLTIWRDNMNANQREDVAITVAYRTIGTVTDVDQNATLTNIRNALNAARIVGDSWPDYWTGDGNWYYPNDATRVQVRQVYGYELDERAGTPWSFGYTSSSGYYVYEMNFQGDAHDSPFESAFININGRLNTPVSNVYVYCQTVEETYGTEGTAQFNASMAVSTGGNFVMAWTEQAEYTNGTASNTNIYYRRFVDDAGDTAGPSVTDVFTEDATPLYEGDTVISTSADGLTRLILTFNEEMLASGVNSITNLNNYQLLLDYDPATNEGVALNGGVYQVVFGMNKAYDLGYSDVPSNKWEAVVTLDGDEETDGAQPLDADTYTLKLISKSEVIFGSPTPTWLCDKSGNPLGATGRHPDGASFTRGFTVGSGTLVAPNLTPYTPTGWSDKIVVSTESGTHTDSTALLTTDTLYLDWAVINNGTVDVEDPFSVALYVDGFLKQTWNVAADTVGAGDEFSVSDFNLGHLTAGTHTLRVLVDRFNQVTERNENDNAYTKIITIGSPSAPTDDDSVTAGLGEDGTTYAEAPGAVAVDADGDYVVVWTAPDASGIDRLYLRMFNANGSVAGPVTAVAPDGSASSIPNDEQRNGTVACDEDGDFVVTWTSYAGDEADIYARRYSAAGETLEDAPFRVNTYLTNNQKWSNVAMDADGDFVITWSSLGQEDNNQLGNGYGVYARRYDSFGQPQAPEFQVNLTTGGDQRFSSVAMDAEGDFVITWTSSANGVGDDVMYRTYLADGSPEDGPMDGEEIANQTLAGTQWHSDVSMQAQGNQFVISWTSLGQDGSGDGIYSRVFTRGEQTQGTQLFSDTDIPATGTFIPDPGLISVDPDIWQAYTEITFEIDITESITIGDLDVRLDIEHGRVSDLTISLIDPSGNEYILSDRNPKDANGAYGDGANFDGTIFDSESVTSIVDGTAPYAGRFAPERNLATLNNTSARGTWTLKIIDWRQGPYDDDNIPIRARILGWTLEIDPAASAGPEFLVNHTTAGNQSYSSVAMDRSGAFLVTWSGRGDYDDDQSQKDVSGSGGVFVQRFDNTVDGEGHPVRIGDETRMNAVTAGSQRLSSIDVDANGNFVVAWTGVDAGNPLFTDVFAIASATWIYNDDTSGPMAIHVLDPATGDRIFSGDVVVSGITEVVVQFDENLWTAPELDGSAGLNSVTNALNWRLDRSGTEIVGGIQDVTFDYNPDTRKYEATVLFSKALAAGEYTLAIRDEITDLAGNALDGDLNGTPGTVSSVTGEAGYRFLFTVPSTATAETRVNQSTETEQQFSQHLGTGQGQEQSTQALAVDNDGDFVVVWTSYGLDDPDDPTGAGVFARVYNRDGEALTEEFPVNESFTTGDQRNASVACDADGDFVIVWESEGQDPNGTWGVYARRYYADGTPKDAEEFRVNTLIANDQVNPAVSMDDMGNFVVVWATGGQSYSFYNDVRAQLFDYNGELVGDEFRVNDANLPGTASGAGSSENNPAVAMDAVGNFVVVWDQVTEQRNGAAYDTVIVGKLFDRTGQPNATTPGEFRVDDGGDDFTADLEHNPTTAASGGNEIEHTARNAQVAMDDAGNFIVTWESFHDNDLEEVAGADSYGIYFRRYNSDGTTEMAVDHQANLVITTEGDDANGDPWTVPNSSIHSDVFAYGQVNPSVAVDADGDYSIVWNGNGAQPDPLHPSDQNSAVVNADSDGVWIRSFHAGIDDGEAEAEYVGVQSRVNLTRQGIQEFATLGMTRDGDMVVVWTGRGVGDTKGIFVRRYNESTDTAGPLVSDIVAGGESLSISEIQYATLDATTGAMVPATVLSTDSTQVDVEVSRLSVVFDEKMLAVGEDDERYDDSVLNPDNYRLTFNGVDVSGWITDDIDFVLNEATNKYEAVLALDSDPSTAVLDPLPDGQYELYINGNVQDVMGNAMGVTGLTPDGIGYVKTKFGVGADGPDDPSEPDVPVDPAPAAPQDSPAVARDPNGEYYVVTWVTRGQTVSRIVAGSLTMRTDADTGMITLGTLLGSSTMTATADVSWTGGSCTGMDATVSGGYVSIDGGSGDDLPALGTLVSVTITVTDASAQGNIAAQVFDADGNKIGDEIVVNTTITGSQIAPDVATDGEGNFVVVWSGLGQHGQSGTVDTSGIYYRRFRISMASETVTALDTYENRVNTYTTNTQNQPAVAMNTDGEFVVTWSGEGREGAPSGAGTADSWGVWARRFNSGGALDTYQTLVNTYRTNTQEASDVAINTDGDYFIVWRSERQDSGAWGVYAQRFTWSDAKDTILRDGTELHLNKTAYGAKVFPQVAMDDWGDSVVVWSGLRSDGFGDDVYMRRYRGTTATDTTEVVVSDDAASAGYLKEQASVAMSSTGNYYVVSWTSWCQDGADDDPQERSDGVYAHMFYNDDPADSDSQWTDYAPGGKLVGDFRVNSTTAGDQNDSYVSMDSNGYVSVAWVGPVTVTDDTTGTLSTIKGIYVRNMTVTDSDAGASTKALVYGTTEDDQVVVDISKSVIGWTVLLNGEPQAINARASGVVIDGRTGTNTLVVDGTTGREIFEIYSDRVVITDPITHFSLTARNIQVANLDGLGGTDRAIFYASTASDVFTFHADTLAASLVSGSNTFAMSNMADVEAQATNANATAVFYDSADKDIFSASASTATLTPYSGAGYSAKATGFRNVQAYSTAGGSDLAKLQGTSGGSTDVLVADPGYTSLTDNSSFAFQANGFREVLAYGSGSSDAATFYDSDSSLPDTFTADATTGEAVMLWGTRAYTKAYLFNNVAAVARSGNTDTAKLNDSAQADTFAADSAGGTLSGTGYSYTATGFRSLYAYASSSDGKSDKAILNDSTGADVFVGTSTYAMMVSPGSTIRANNFDSNAAWSTKGGTDTAKLYDSAKNDTLTVAADSASLLTNEAHSFARVQAFSAKGGSDTAKFTDSSEKDWFVAGQGYAYIYNQSRSYYARATGFRYVEATSSGQGDQANLTDSALDDTFNGYATRAELLFGPSASLGSVSVSGFPNVTASATVGGTDVANLAGSAGNDSFAGSFNGSTATGTLSGQDSDGTYFSVRAEKFEQVKAAAGASGSHSARLADSAVADLLLHLEGSAARLTDLDAVAGLWATGFGSVNATLSSKDDRVEIVPPVDYDYSIDQPE